MKANLRQQFGTCVDSSDEGVECMKCWWWFVASSGYFFFFAVVWSPCWRRQRYSATSKAASSSSWTPRYRPEARRVLSSFGASELLENIPKMYVSLGSLCLNTVSLLRMFSACERLSLVLTGHQIHLHREVTRSKFRSPRVTKLPNIGHRRSFVPISL